MGRRKGLKIPRGLHPVPVRLRPQAPIIPRVNQAANLLLFEFVWTMAISSRLSNPFIRWPRVLFLSRGQYWLSV